MSDRLEFDLSKHQTVSNPLPTSPSPPADGQVGRADIYPDLMLMVDQVGEDSGFDIRVIRKKDLKGLRARSFRKAVDVFHRVRDCRSVWDQHIVNLNRPVINPLGAQSSLYPFQAGWDFQQDATLLDDAAPHLARAGDDLFTLIFEREGNDELIPLGGWLRSLLRAGSGHIVIYSESLFLPWGMLYTHPVEGQELAADGSNWLPEGFWGYQHIVQQSPNEHPIDQRILPDKDGVKLSLNINRQIATQFNLPEVTEHFNYIGALGRPCIERGLKSELQRDLKGKAAQLERVLYFYCHGHGSTDSARVNLDESQIKLSDKIGEEIRAVDFQLWLGKLGLPTNPLLFFNACQGGQMTTMFYRTFAVDLLKYGAAGLVGSQVDIPAAFAAEYGRRVMGQFFGKGRAARLGELLRDINRDLFKNHGNPLGLVYSLYRGDNCFIDRPPLPSSDADASA